MTLEGNSSHLRLAVERNFPFNTCHLHLLQHQPALRPGTESNRPQGKPDTSMLHPQIPLGDRAAHTGGDQITSHTSSPNTKTLPPSTQKPLPEDKRHVNRYVDAPGTATQVSKTLVSAASCTVNSVTLGKSTVGKERNKA